MGRDLDCMADVLMGVPPIHFFQAENTIQFRSPPMRFLGFSNHEKGAPRQEISKCSTVCSTFSGSGWSVVRSASLAKGGTPKKRPSPHLHKVPTRSIKVCPRTFQTALSRARVCMCVCIYIHILNIHLLQCIFRRRHLNPSSESLIAFIYVYPMNTRGFFP
jgi:hypothetical protein